MPSIPENRRVVWRMIRDLTVVLEEWIASGRAQIGEIDVARAEPGYELRHWADRGRDDLIFYDRPEDARTIANLDETGAFRPLKSAPNLRRGWRLALADSAALRRALDYFYPAMTGVFMNHQGGALQPVTLRETLGRQTGMYAATRKLTDREANELIGRFCPSQRAREGEKWHGCLKTILWRISDEAPIDSLPGTKFDVEHDQSGGSGSGCVVPLLCHEACNLLVAEARTVVKRRASAE